MARVIGNLIVRGSYCLEMEYDVVFFYVTLCVSVDIIDLSNEAPTHVRAIRYGGDECFLALFVVERAEDATLNECRDIDMDGERGVLELRETGESSTDDSNEEIEWRVHVELQLLYKDVLLIARHVSDHAFQCHNVSIGFAHFLVQLIERDELCEIVSLP